MSFFFPINIKLLTFLDQVSVADRSGVQLARQKDETDAVIESLF